MPKDLSNINTDKDDLSPKQKRLIVWRDYFKMLREGIALQPKGSPSEPWEERDVELNTWLDVVITEIEGDIMHLECGQEEYCRWGDAKDLTKLSGNIDARDD